MTLTTTPIPTPTPTPTSSLVKTSLNKLLFLYFKMATRLTFHSVRFGYKPSLFFFFCSTDLKNCSRASSEKGTVLGHWGKAHGGKEKHRAWEKARYNRRDSCILQLSTAVWSYICPFFIFIFLSVGNPPFSSLCTMPYVVKNVREVIVCSARFWRC